METCLSMKLMFLGNSTHVHTVTRVVVLETVPHIVLLWSNNVVSLPYNDNLLSYQQKVQHVIVVTLVGVVYLICTHSPLGLMCTCQTKHNHMCYK